MEIFVILKPDGTPFYRDDAMGILATDSEAQAGRFAYAREDEGAEYARYTRATPQPSADAVRELVQRWRDEARDMIEIHGSDQTFVCVADALDKMADELESLLGRGG